MFIDKVSLTLSSGNGGKGSVSFRREKHVIMGGPDGGDGGRGGDIIINSSNNTHTLSYYKGKKHLKARNGEDGMGRNMYGKKGESLVLKVPPGTIIIDKDTNEILHDFKENDSIVFLKGGLGGLGNSHFKSSTNQRPSYAQPGVQGESKEIIFELRLIADVGLLGFPNVGKSTLISTLSNARPQIANYEFTTLSPKLGLVKVDEFNSFVMADIPGIIEGASDGKGLGLEFLKHIKRTKVLLFMLEINNYRSLEEQYEKLKIEIQNFSQKLSSKKYAIAITKTDVLDDESVNEKVQAFIKYLNFEIKNHDSVCHIFYKQDEIFKNENDAKFILTISSATQKNINNLKFWLWDMLNE